MRQRFHHDEAAVAAVYQGVEHPLTPEDIAECVAWCATRPAHVDVDLMEVGPSPRPPSTRCTARTDHPLGRDPSRTPAQPAQHCPGRPSCPPPSRPPPAW
jgi:hypothetical protein